MDKLLNPQVKFTPGGRAYVDTEDIVNNALERIRTPHLEEVNVDAELLILRRLEELLESDPIALRRFWNEHFPEKELERFANSLGYSFD